MTTFFTLRSKNGFHVFNNNSAESEPIWMKSLTLWAKCRGLALADFGHDPCISGSLRGILFPKKRRNCSQNFQVITPRWLQIARNSRPNGPSMGCLVSIFTVRINSKSFPWEVRYIQERYLPKFSAFVHGHCGRLAESWRKSKQTNVVLRQ